jgi:hypothetical protein
MKKNLCNCEDCQAIIQAQRTKEGIMQTSELSTIQPRSQKAKGLIQLNNLMYSIGGWEEFKVLPIKQLIQSDEQLNRWLGSKFTSPMSKYMVFARPCPVLPRHGFVDSRVCNTEAEIRQVWQETRQEDEQGELLLCPLITSQYNSILTPSVVTVGKGNDGATAGKDCVSFPVAGDLIPPGLMIAAGITNSPYVEAVYTEKNVRPYLTQLRDGPQVSVMVDVIPFDVAIVEEILVVDPALQENPKALLEWDTLITSKEGSTSTVVYHKGGAITSHFGVHCKIHNIPYITSFKPEIGQAIPQSKEVREVDYRLVSEGLSAGFSREYTDWLGDKAKSTDLYACMLAPSLYTLHGMALLTPQQSKLLGFGMANLIRLSTAACLGELRHFSPIARLEGKKDRSEIYKRYMVDIFAGVSKLRLAHKIFSEGRWAGSFGGKAWANCTAATIDLVNAIVRFQARPSTETLAVAKGAFNILVNCVHNGGLFLNKFASETMFNLAANNIAIFTARYAPCLFESAKLIEGLKVTEVKWRKKAIPSKVLGKQKELAEKLLAFDLCQRCGQNDEACRCNLCGGCGEKACVCFDEDEDNE